MYFHGAITHITDYCFASIHIVFLFLQTCIDDWRDGALETVHLLKIIVLYLFILYLYIAHTYRRLEGWYLFILYFYIADTYRGLE